MRGSTLFLGFTLVALATALTLLWQSFSPRLPAPTPNALEPPVAEAPRPKPPRVQPQEQASTADPGVRSVYPGMGQSAARAPRTDETTPSLSPSLRREEPPMAAQELRSEPDRSAALEPPSSDIPPPVGETSAPSDAVDLNTAPLEALNGLGAGMIGKTIIANRPYASPDELLSRRVLKRQDFETIRPRVVVR